MRPEELAASLRRLLGRSPAFPGEALAVDLIANPRAGGFMRPSHSRRHLAELAELESRAASLPAREPPASLELRRTERSGHASDIAREIIRAALAESPRKRHVIMTAGGDGTSLETATALVELPPEERGRFSILRLPMGTGNDGSEGRDLVACLGRLLGRMAFAPRRAIQIVPNPEGGRAPLWSFNIASVGLDAFVCKMTNALKSVFPGDSYKFWVDIAAVFYDLFWPPAALSAKAFDESGRETASFEEPCLFCAIGVSGNRQYGSNIPILPDDDNVIAVRQIYLPMRLAFKGRIAAGKHRGLDIVRLLSAARLRLDYSRGILLQREGEVTELGPGDFPLEFRIGEPVYNVLSPA